MRVLETFIVLLIATVAFLWVILAHSTQRMRLKAVRRRKR
jgi:hypothetical protein